MLAIWIMIFVVTGVRMLVMRDRSRDDDINGYCLPVCADF